MAFDPDSYLAQKPGEAPAETPVAEFDADAYLKTEAPQMIPQEEADRLYAVASGRVPEERAQPLSAQQDVRERFQSQAYQATGRAVQGVARGLDAVDALIANVLGIPGADPAADDLNKYLFGAAAKPTVGRTNTAIRNVGRAIESVGQSEFTPDPGRDRNLLAKGAEMAGGFAPLVVAGVANPLLGAAGGGATMSEQGAREAEARGADAAGVNRSAAINLAGGTALGLLPIPGVQRMQPTINRMVSNPLARRGLQGVVGGISGAAVNAAGDAALQQADTGKVDWSRVGENAAVGGAVGTGIGLGTKPRVDSPGVNRVGGASLEQKVAKEAKGPEVLNTPELTAESAEVGRGPEVAPVEASPVPTAMELAASDHMDQALAWLREEGVSLENAERLIRGEATPKQIAEEQLGVRRNGEDADSMIIEGEDIDPFNRTIRFEGAGIADRDLGNTGALSHVEAIKLAVQQAETRIGYLLASLKSSQPDVFVRNPVKALPDAAPVPTAMDQMRAEQLAALAPEARAVVEKFPDLAIAMTKDNIPIEIRKADGTSEGALFNGWWGDGVPSIARYKPDAGGFSHGGVLGEGDVIASKVPTPEQWARGVREASQDLRALPAEALVESLGKREQVIQGVGGEEQWQVRLPGETGRGRTMTAQKLADLGYLPPEPRQRIVINGESAEVPVSKLPGAMQAALLDQEVPSRSPANGGGGTPGGPISPTAINSGPQGPAPEGQTPLKLIESAKKSPGVREDLKQALGGSGPTIGIPETMAEAKAAIDAFPSIDEATKAVLADNSATPMANAMGLELFRKLQVENRLQDAASVIFSLAQRARTQGQAIRILAELSRSTADGMVAYATKLFDRALTPAEVNEINSAMKRIGNAKFDEVRVARTMDLLDRLNAKSPRRAKWDEKASALLNIGMLMHPKTIFRNVLGNGLMATTNLAADVLVPLADAGVGVWTGKRTVRGPQMAEYLKTLFTTNAQDFRKGYEQARSEGAGKRASFKEGFDTAAAMGKLVSGDKLEVGDLMSAYRATFSNPVMKGLEKTMSLVMGGPDRAFYTARFKASLADQMKAADAKVPTADMVDRASIEAARAVYQDKNFVSDALRETRSTLNKVSTLGASSKFGAGQAIVPFVQVPGALLLRGAEFTPLGFLKAMAEGVGPLFTKKQFNQREFSQAFSRALAGTAGLAAAGYALSQLGIVSGTKDSDPKVRALQRSLGLGGYQVNVSALKRAFQSMDWKTRQPTLPTDSLYTYDWAQPVAFPVAMGASMAEARRKAQAAGQEPGASDRPSEVLAGLMSGARTIEEQPLLAGLTGFMQETANARQEGAGVLEALAGSMLKLPGQFVPTAVRSVQQLMDNRIYETRGSDKLETAYQGVAANIPGLAAALGYKPRTDMLGDLAERYQANGNTLFNVLINPGFSTKFKSDPELRELYGIWQATGETKQIPGSVDAKVTINGQPKVLTAAERADYQQYVGRATRDVFKQLMRSEGYYAADDDQRAKVLAQVVSAANTAAKIQLFGDRPERLDKYDRALLRLAQKSEE